MGDHASLDYIVGNLAALLAELDRRLRIVRDFVRQVADARATGLYLHGIPGSGKTYTVCRTLDQTLGAPHVYRRGQLTPMGLFELIADNPDEIIVLDDLSRIFKSDVALQILLAALEPPSTRDRSRRVTYKRLGEERVAVFRGGIICISNIELRDRELLGAFMSRVNTFNYNPSEAQLGALMLDIASRGYPATKTPTIKPEEAMEVARFVIEEMLRLGCRFDLRVLVDKAFPSYQQFKDGEAESDWRDLVTATIEQKLSDPQHEGILPETRQAQKEQDRQVIREILGTCRTSQEQIGEWMRRTGKSARAFYRRRAEVENH